MKSIGKPDARNGHVRFDERGRETGRRFVVSTRARPRLYNLKLNFRLCFLWHMRTTVYSFEAYIWHTTSSAREVHRNHALDLDGFAIQIIGLIAPLLHGINSGRSQHRMPANNP